MNFGIILAIIVTIVVVRIIFWGIKTDPGRIYLEPGEYIIIKTDKTATNNRNEIKQ